MSEENKPITLEGVTEELLNLADIPEEKEDYVYTQTQLARALNKSSSTMHDLIKRFDRHLVMYRMRTAGKGGSSVMYSERGYKFLQTIIVLRENFRVEYNDIIDTLQTKQLPVRLLPDEKKQAALAREVAESYTAHVDEKFDDLNNTISELLEKLKASDENTVKLERAVNDRTDMIIQQFLQLRDSEKSAAELEEKNKKLEEELAAVKAELEEEKKAAENKKKGFWGGLFGKN